MDFALDYNSLSKKFSEVESELDETFVSIRKLTLRYQNSFVSSELQKQFYGPLERNFPSKEIPDDNKQDQFCYSSESEESASDDDSPSEKIALQSAVISKIETSKARKKFIGIYHSDSNAQRRNRRFLGMVQNTLQKFKDEEVIRQPQGLKQKTALEKVEAAVANDKISVQKEKAELISKSKKQRLELECLGKMMNIAESFELWENSHKCLCNFIATKAEPQIFFLPRTSSSAESKQHEKSRMKINEKIERQRALVESVLLNIKQSCGLWTPSVVYGPILADETTSVSEVESQNVLEPIVTGEETKDAETLCLDLSENESEDFL